MCKLILNFSLELFLHYENCCCLGASRPGVRAGIRDERAHSRRLRAARGHQDQDGDDHQVQTDKVFHIMCKAIFISIVGS